MKRRMFITLGGAAGTSMLLPLVARAQPHERVRRIGLLFGLAETDEVSQSYLAVFRQRLQELGWSEGRNFRIDYRWGAADHVRISNLCGRTGGP